MTTNNAFNPEIVLSYYADWIAWLRERKAELLKQAAKMTAAKPAPQTEAAPEAGSSFVSLAFGSQAAPPEVPPVTAAANPAAASAPEPAAAVPVLSDDLDDADPPEETAPAAPPARAVPPDEDLDDLA